MAITTLSLFRLKVPFSFDLLPDMFTGLPVSQLEMRLPEGHLSDNSKACQEASHQALLDFPVLAGYHHIPGTGERKTHRIIYHDTMPKNSPRPTLADLGIVIFDMDGVLIDVADSYRRTIVQTVEIYLTQGLGFSKARQPLVTEGDILLFKQIGGFNNDWDLTTALLFYFLSLTDMQPSEMHATPQTLDEALHILRAAGHGRHMSAQALLRKKNVTEFIRRIRHYGNGLEAMRKLVDSNAQALVFSEGDLNSTNLVKRMFQEIYLGPHFQRIHHSLPRFYKGQGMYRKEKLLIKRETLKRLSRRVTLGIASGRPRAEAILALDRFGIGPYFKSLITLDECEEAEARLLRDRKKTESLSKPHPFSVIEAVRRISTSSVSSAYVGDVPDDIEAAKRAKGTIDILAVGCLAPYKNDRDKMKDLLMAHGADLVVESPDELMELLASGTG